MPTSWRQWDQAVYRACGVCMHGRAANGQAVRGSHQQPEHCACPEVTGGNAPVPVALARANAGACGPEAHHQDFPGLRPGPRTTHGHAHAI